MKKRSNLSAVSPVLLGLALLCATFTDFPAFAFSHSGQVTEEFHQTYPLASGGRVELENTNGEVHITAWDRNEVKVDAVKYADSKERLDQATIKVDAGSGSISIRTDYHDHSLTFTHPGGNNPASVDYTLTVPRNARLDEIKLVNGPLEIDGVTGEVRASTVNGALTAHGLGGEAEISTVNGRSEIDFAQMPSRSIDISSVNGSVEVTLPSDARADIEASTVSGHIENDFGLHVNNHQYVGHSLKGQLGGGGTRIKLSNVNGRIDLRHANDGKALSTAKDTGHHDKDDDDGDDDSI